MTLQEEDAWQAAEERENRANELGGVVEQFENAVTALQELEAKHSEVISLRNLCASSCSVPPFPTPCFGLS